MGWCSNQLSVQRTCFRNGSRPDWGCQKPWTKNESEVARAIFAHCTT